jgi:hypothetical protein
MAYFSRRTSGINPYAAGNKIYGGGRSNPTSGPVDPLGYRERDAKAEARRAAILRRLKSMQQGKYASADALRKV